MLQRATGILELEQRTFRDFEIRAVDDELRIIEGTANTAAIDDYGTILEPKGARFTLPLPLLWMHRQDTPVGDVIEATVTKGRIRIKAQIRKISEPGPLKDDCDRAYQACKYKLVRGLSVGFTPVEGGMHGNTFTDWNWRELSLVTLPANEEATITKVRSAASGDPHPASRGRDSGNQPNPSNPRRAMTLQEQIQQHENSRAAKLAQRQSVFDRCGAEGRTPEPPENENLETLAREVQAHDDYLAQLYVQRNANVQQAAPVAGQNSAAASASRGTVEAPVTTQRGVPTVRVQSREKPGSGFARYVMALVACQGNRSEAAEYARATWGDQGEGVALMHRAAVAAGTTTNATYAAPLVQTNYVNEFLELLRPKTLIGRIPGLNDVPFYTQMTVQTAGGTYTWVGQGVPKPVTNLQVAAVSLAIAKAAGIIVISEELARNSTPRAQDVVTNEMMKGMQQYLDTQFVDPAVAAVANVSPASITNGVTGTAASGTTEAAARADLRALIGAFGAANLDLGGLVILMGETLAFKLGTMVNSVGGPAFPGITIAGGSILGVPVVTSNVTPLQTRMVAVHAPSVMIADDGGTDISISREATIIMDSTPATVVQAAGAAPIHTSLWQNNLVGIRAERWINWGKARATAVDMIHTIAYA